MKAVWTAGLPEEDAERIKSEFGGSRYLFDRFLKIIEDWEKESIRRMRNPKIFEIFKWHDRVANELGFQRALDKIKDNLKE